MSFEIQQKKKKRQHQIIIDGFFFLIFFTETSNIADDKMQKKVRKSSKVSKPMLRTESVHSNSITTMSVVTSATRTKEQTDQQQLIEW